MSKKAKVKQTSDQIQQNPFPMVPLDELIFNLADSFSWSVLVAAQNIAKIEGVGLDASTISNMLILAINDIIDENLKSCEEIEAIVAKAAAAEKATEKPAARKKVTKKHVKKVASKKSTKKPAARSK